MVRKSKKQKRIEKMYRTKTTYSVKFVLPRIVKKARSGSKAKHKVLDFVIKIKSCFRLYDKETMEIIKSMRENYGYLRSHDPNRFVRIPEVPLNYETIKETQITDNQRE